MEEPWVQHVRSMSRKQNQAIVDGSITEDNHIVLRRGDGSDVDVGAIKEKKPTTIVYVGWDTWEGLDVFTSKDGDVWIRSGLNHKSNNNWEGIGANSGCWTGDRFLLNAPQTDPIYSSLIESKAGTTWSRHPDRVTFSPGCDILSMDTDQRGLIVAGGIPAFGASQDSNLVVSRDFGETWEVFPDNISIYPFSGKDVYGVCVKNEFEWIIRTHVYGPGTIEIKNWYTNDSGGNWSEVILPAEFDPHIGVAISSGMRYFKGHWWFFGDGSGTGQWDTPIIKSADLINWIPVVTPWSGTYPPLEAYNGVPHNNDSGLVWVMEYDPFTNTVMATGHSPETQSPILFSPDGGDTWIEIGHVDQDFYRTLHGFDGFYILPDNGYIFWEENGAITCVDGVWYITNGSDGNNKDISPNMFRISLDGRTADMIRLRSELFHDGHVLMSNQDKTSIIVDGG